MVGSKFKYSLTILLITLFSVGAVEAFYFALDKKLASQSEPDTPGAAAPLPITPGAATPQTAENPTERPPQTAEIDIDAITRRNLFASQITAQPADKDPLEGLQDSSLAVVLMGTISGHDRLRRAIIYDVKTRKQELYQRGDFVHDAAIKKILRGKVIVSYNGKDEMLDIAYARNVKVPQVKRVVAPTTTSRRVVGRPAGQPPGDEERDIGDRDPGTAVAVPVPRDPTKILPVRKGVIVQGRDTSSQ